MKERLHQCLSSALSKASFSICFIGLLVFLPKFSLASASKYHAELTSTASKQSTSIRGTITDSEGKGLPEVSVYVKGTTTGTTTKSDGSYQLQVPNSQQHPTLVFSYIGYITQERTIADRNTIDVVLMADQKTLDDVVVVGYGTQKKTSLTAAVSAVKGDDIANTPMSDVSNGLGGRMPGIIFTQNSGEPGADGSNIRIRGASTTGSTAPLVIVDGVPRNFNRLDPHSIESITILKDAAAVAPYGMAGANGVILVTTKSGQKGAVDFSYNGYMGWQDPTILTKFANSYQFATLFNMANDNAGQPHRYSAEDLQKFQDGSDPIGHPNHNVLKELINSGTPLTNHNLDISGGSDKVNFYIGLNYLYQAGMWGPTNLRQYNLTSKVNVQATKTTNISLSINDRVQQSNYPGVATEGAGNIFSQAFRTPPNVPLAFEDNLPAEYQGRSVYGQIHNSGYNHYRDYVLYNQLSVEQQLPFLEGLSIKGVVAYDLTPTFKQIWLTPIPYYTVDLSQQPYVYNQSGNDGPSKPAFTESYNEAQAFTYQGYINYKHTFGQHDVGGLVVLESRNINGANFAAGRTNYNINIPELNTGSSTPGDITNNGSSSENKQRSLIYRLTYAYAGKYLLETSGRYDGNYYFAPGHRYGFFPSFSAGWRLSEEKFMKNKLSWLDNLKIRGSYGESGALAGSPFQYLSSYSLYGNSAVIGGAPTQGIYETLEPNTTITWERAKKTNIGLELSLWNSLLTFNGDWFYEKRSNMLVQPQVQVPFEYGIGIAQENAGKMENKGFELELGSHYQFKSGLRLGFQGNFTFAKNKLLEIFETPTTYNNPNRRVTGRALGTKFGYQALGYFQLTDDKNSNGIIDDDEYAKQPWGTVHPGDLKYQDTNADGIINEQDMVPIGNPDVPQIIYGFSPSIAYKGFDLNLLFQGAAKRDVWIGDVGAWPFTNASSVPITALDVWTPDNPNAANPRVTTIPATNNTQYSSWWLHHASYLRLKSGELGYTLPQTFIKSIGLQSFRIYVSGQNLLTWTPLKNFDPEISNNYGLYYPQQRVISLGVNVKF